MHWAHSVQWEARACTLLHLTCTLQLPITSTHTLTYTKERNKCTMGAKGAACLQCRHCSAYSSCTRVHAHMCAQHLPALGCPPPAPWAVPFLMFILVSTASATCVCSVNKMRGMTVMHPKQGVLLHPLTSYLAWFTHHNPFHTLQCSWMPCTSSLGKPASVCCACTSVHITCQPLAAIPLLPGMCLFIYH